MNSGSSLCQGPTVVRALRLMGSSRHSLCPEWCHIKAPSARLLLGTFWLCLSQLVSHSAPQSPQQVNVHFEASSTTVFREPSPTSHTLPASITHSLGVCCSRLASSPPPIPSRFQLGQRSGKIPGALEARKRQAGAAGQVCARTVFTETRGSLHWTK
uniref:uncharacterized protein LOC118151350 n=1 Tax=Callithrix jacchus TaxID=9483 RepID=UPI0023DCF246|nr:uncharacterized protein LOC118151350 [Callithrix jacchus]